MAGGPDEPWRVSGNEWVVRYNGATIDVRRHNPAHRIPASHYHRLFVDEVDATLFISALRIGQWIDLPQVSDRRDSSILMH